MTIPSKSIKTLVADIYAAVDGGVTVTPEASKAFGEQLSRIISERLGEDRNAPNYLRPSNIGEQCDRKLWYSINQPEKGEGFSPDTRLKFLLGDVWEAVLLFLAEIAGHKVEGRQDTVGINGVQGSRDAVIDGVLVDAKSASTYSFHKFNEGLKPEQDAFGYIKQLNFYLEASQDDPLVTEKDKAAFLVGDKTLGKLTLDVHKRKGFDYETLIEQRRAMLASPELPPRGYQDVPQSSTSPNKKLGVACSYCQFRSVCWPGLRTFAYSSGPQYLTKVVKEPNVTEIR